jgi:[ribosomal protein S5]-alanine N-acetyltransferase
MEPVTISDEQHPDPIRLRPYAPEDLDDVLAMCTDPQIQRWTKVPAPYHRVHAEQFLAEVPGKWADDTRWSFAVESPDDDGRPRFAGSLSLSPLGAGAANVGFNLAPWARGRGVMSRALRLGLGWGFDRAGLTVVRWQAVVGNWPSRRVAWACGFQIEGTVRGLAEQRGMLHDGWIGSLVRGDPMVATGRWLAAPTIRGELVVLRAWREDDAPRVAEACREADTLQWLPQLPSPYTLADAQWYIGSREEEHARADGIFWCVADPDDDRCLGSLGLMNPYGPNAQPEAGYWAHPDARGRGVMTEAVRLAVRHAFIDWDDGGLGLHRVMLRAAAGNAASNRVAERAGFIRYGVARQAETLRDGRRDDFNLYEYLRD